MEFVGIFVGKTNIEKGRTDSGQDWQKTTALFETIEQYPKKVAVSCINKMVLTASCCKKGTLYRVKLDADSHEYQGRYYTELRAWSIKPAYNVDAAADSAPQAQPVQPSAPSSAPDPAPQAPQAQPSEPETPIQDLPFDIL